MSGKRNLALTLLLGDAVSFLAFATMGRAEHATGLSPVAVALTALPFMAAWYPIALWRGAFRAPAIRTPLAAAVSVLLPWLLAWPLGLQLRALFLDRTIPFSFAMVTFAVNLALLAGWRALFAALTSRQKE